MTGCLAETVWVDEFKQQELQEHARVLYVALTRAVETVFLSWSSPAKRDSWAEMTRLDLTPGVHQKESYSYLVHSEPESLKDNLSDSLPAPLCPVTPDNAWGPRLTDASGTQLAAPF